MLVRALSHACGKKVRKDLQRDVLKGARRAVEQLHRPELIAQRVQRHDRAIVKARIGLLRISKQLLPRKAGQKPLEHRGGKLRIRQREKRFELGRGKDRQSVRHIQSAVRRKPPPNGLRRRDRRRFSSGTDKLHGQVPLLRTFVFLSLYYTPFANEKQPQKRKEIRNFCGTFRQFCDILFDIPFPGGLPLCCLTFCTRL